MFLEHLLFSFRHHHRYGISGEDFVERWTGGGLKRQFTFDESEAEDVVDQFGGAKFGEEGIVYLRSGQLLNCHGISGLM